MDYEWLKVLNPLYKCIRIFEYIFGKVQRFGKVQLFAKVQLFGEVQL